MVQHFNTQRLLLPVVVTFTHLYTANHTIYRVYLHTHTDHTDMVHYPHQMCRHCRLTAAQARKYTYIRAFTQYLWRLIVMAFGMGGVFGGKVRGGAVVFGVAAGGFGFKPCECIHLSLIIIKSCRNGCYNTDCRLPERLWAGRAGLAW